MKIRIKGNSIRYRLTKTDVDRFISEGSFKEETNFGNRVLSYMLKTTDAPLISATYEADSITLFMPAEMANAWGSTERVGFENEYEGLRLFIEKDFKCLDNVAEDQSDNYPNPLAAYSYEQ